MFADVDGYSAFIDEAILDGPESIKRAATTIHAIREELNDVLQSDFKGKRARFIGDCIQGMIAEGAKEDDGTEPVSNIPRINSVVMHELSHIMLGHELESAGISDDGHLIPSNFNQEQEDEADWLAGTLLLPRPALLSIKKSDISDQDAMQMYSVSRQMLTWRVRMTGVNYQLSYARGRS